MADFTPAYLILAAESGQLSGYARKFKNDAIAIKRNTDACSPSFHLLSSLAFELFPKVLVSYDVYLKYKDKTKEEISAEQIRMEVNQEMRSFGHDLAALFNHFPDLLKKLDIKSIVKFQNSYIWEYRIVLNNNPYEIGIKDVEAGSIRPFCK